MPKHFLFILLCVSCAATAQLALAQATKPSEVAGPPSPPPSTRPSALKKTPKRRAAVLFPPSSVANIKTKISGRVLDSQGKPVPGVKVQLQRSLFPEEYVLIKVENGGHFSLTTEKYGAYWLVASAKQYRTERSLLLLSQSRSITIQAQLARKQPKAGKTSGWIQIKPDVAAEAERARRYYVQCVKRSRKAQKEFRKTGKSYKYFKFNWKPILATFRQRRNSVSEPLLKDLWLLYRIGLPISFYRYSKMQALMTARKKSLVRMLQRSSFHSPLWEISGRLTFTTIQYNFQRKAGPVFRALLRGHPNPGVSLALRSRLVFNKGLNLRHLRAERLSFLEKARMNSRQKRKHLQQAKALQARIVKLEKVVQGHFAQVEAIVRRHPSKRLKELRDRIRYTFTERFPNGSKVPPFRVKLTDHPEKEFAPRHLQQRLTLVMFWATWCGPCVAKFPQIVALGNTYKKKLQILAVSHDRDLRTWREFRRTKWKMPWYNTVLGKAPFSPLGRLFRVRVLPTMFLLGRDGTVLANGTTLRSSGWLQKIKQILSRNAPTSQPR